MADNGFLTFVNADGGKTGMATPVGMVPSCVLGDLLFSVRDVEGRVVAGGEAGVVSEQTGIDWSVTVAPSFEGNGVVVRASVVNNTSDTVRLASATFETPVGGTGPSVHGDLSDWSRYRMGFNTAAPSGAAPLNVPDKAFFMRLPYSWLPASARMMVFFDDTAFSPKPGVIQSEWFSALFHRPSETGVLFGFFGVSHHFSRVDLDLNSGRLCMTAFLDGAGLEPGQKRELDPLMVVCGNDFNGLLNQYAVAVADTNGARVNPARIWCSWYSGFYDRVTVRDIRENMRRLALAGSPVEYVQLDDGYQSCIGDWLVTNSRFPEGLEALACEIRQAGFKPGIWTAPFSVSPESNLYAEHPEWIVRDGRGRPVRAGFIMGRFGPRPYYALDTTIPEVRTHVSSMFRRLRSMGWQLFKVDFLTSAMISGVRSDITKTRAEAYRMGMQAVREGVGDDGIVLTGIGPFLANVGLIDIQRLSPDTCFGSPAWKTLEQKMTGDRMTPGVRNQTAGSIARTFTNDILWSGDPDAIVGPGLSAGEATYLKTVALMTGSALTIGHDFTKGGFDFTGFEPLVSARGPAVVADLGERQDPRHLVLDIDTEGRRTRYYAMLNPSDRPDSFEPIAGVIGGASVSAVELWTGAGYRLEPGKPVGIPARSAMLFVIEPDSSVNPVE